MFLSVKKQVEWLLLEYFRQLYPRFPKGKVIPSESPDFIIEQSPRYKTGIELVRLHPANGKPFPEYSSVSGFEEQYLGMVRELVTETVSRNLFVKFLFSHPPASGQVVTDRMACQTAEMISACVPVKSKTFFFRKLLGRELLPELESILVIYHPRLELPVWECADYSAINTDVTDDLVWSVSKKEEKIPLYQHHRLNQYWLLVTATTLRAGKGSAVQDRMNNPLGQTSFHRIFLLDMMNARVFSGAGK